LYQNFLPLLNSGRVTLPRNDRLVAQIVALERQVSRGGRDSIDHPRGGHDDLANAVAGAASIASKGGYNLDALAGVDENKSEAELADEWNKQQHCDAAITWRTLLPLMKGERPMNKRYDEDAEDDENNIIPDGGKVTVSMFMMNSVQRAVAGVPVSDAEAIYQEFAATRDAMMAKRNADLRAITYGDYSSLDATHAAAVPSRAIRSVQIADAWKSPASAPTKLAEEMTADEVWRQRGERIRNAWRHS
jgi:hypothetical protein